MTTLADLVQAEQAAPMPDAVRQMARDLAQAYGARAALFYGSILRTGDLDGILDFYLLTSGPHRTGLHGLAERGLWPEVSYHQRDIGGVTLNAKVAVMPLATFRRAAKGTTLDTTIWTRFVQPSALAWAADETAAAEIAGSIAAACETAARFAAALGPPRDPPLDFWRALFRNTYAAELRVEKAGRERQILEYDPDRYERLLRLAWEAGGIGSIRIKDDVSPQLSPAERRRLTSAWALRRRLGKPLNLARLIKAAFTFEGAARYAAWKIERHTGTAVPLTPWRERHPILSAPGVLWRLRKAKKG